VWVVCLLRLLLNLHLRCLLRLLVVVVAAAVFVCLLVVAWLLLSFRSSVRLNDIVVNPVYSRSVFCRPVWVSVGVEVTVVVAVVALVVAIIVMMFACACSSCAAVCCRRGIASSSEQYEPSVGRSSSLSLLRCM